MKAQFSKHVASYDRPIPMYGGGLVNSKPTYYIRIFDEANSKYGVGECAATPGVSSEYDNVEAYEAKLHELCANVAHGQSTDLMEYSSIMCGFESAIQDFSSGCRRVYYDTPFTAGNDSVPTVGFVPVTSPDETLTDFSKCVSLGYTTIKLSMTDSDADQLIDTITRIRATHYSNTIKIRLDANGLLHPDEAMRLVKLLPIHSVQCLEQPIAVGQWEQMAQLCSESTIPIALDEELAGIVNPMAMMQLIRTIKPHILCVKPSLCGGFSTAIHWLKMSAQFNLGCWVASAGETSVGLDSLCQWTSLLQPRIAQEIDVQNALGGFAIDNGGITRSGAVNPMNGLIWKD